VFKIVSLIEIINEFEINKENNLKKITYCSFNNSKEVIQ